MEIRKASVNNIGYMKISSSKPITCNFVAPFEIEEIQSATVTVYTADVLYGDKTCTLKARANLNAICLSDGATVSCENTVDFDVLFECEKITENCLLHSTHIAQNVKVERQDDSYAISAIIDSEMDFFVLSPLEYTADCDGAIVKRKEQNTLSFFAFCKGENDFEQEKEISLLAYKMLSHEESARISGVQCGINEVIADGEVYAEFLFITERGEIFKETLICPFRYEIECNNCLPEMTANVYCEVVSLAYRMENDQSSGKNNLYASYSLRFCAVVFENKSVSCIDDAFSTDCELGLRREEYEFFAGVKEKEMRYKCFGEATCDLDGKNVLSVIGGGVYALSYNKEGENLVIGGILHADVLGGEKDGEKAQGVCELTFQTSFLCEGTPLSLIATKRNVTVKKLDDKYVLEGEIVFSAVCVQKTRISMVAEIEEGAKKVDDDSAVKIIFVEKGDELWTVCKKAGVNEDTLKVQNPDLIFPAEKHTGIVVYRKIDL